MKSTTSFNLVKVSRNIKIKIGNGKVWCDVKWLKKRIGLMRLDLITMGKK